MTQVSQRIGIDCRLAGKKHAGIGRYIENLITRLPHLHPETTWIYFFHDATQAKDIGEFPSNVKVVFAPVRHYSIAEQLKMPAIFSKEKLDLLHVPHFNIPLRYSGKFVVTIHDLLWHQYKGAHVTTLPTWQYWFKHKVYLYTVSQAVKRAVKILVPAETIRKTVQEFYPVAHNKIVVTKEGIDEHFSFKTSPKKTIKKQFVYVGSLYPHKNIRVVIDALERLPEYALIVVGARNVFQDQVREYVSQKGLSARVKFAGYLSDEALLDLYQESQALVQPSLSEGFGLTGVEAMVAGIPVIASEIRIFQEIYQKAALFFDPASVDSFVYAVKKLEDLDRKEVIGLGKKVASQYSWDTMAQETAQAYIKALKET